MRGLSLFMARHLSVWRRWVVWCAFALLCLMTSLEWVIPPATTEVPSLQRQGLMYVIVGLCGTARLGLSRTTRVSVARWGWIALAGALFLGVPAILLDTVNGAVSSVSATVVLAMTPVIVLLAVACGGWGVAE